MNHYYIWSEKLHVSNATHSGLHYNYGVIYLGGLCVFILDDVSIS